MSKQLIEEREALVATFESTRVAMTDIMKLSEESRKAVRDFDAEHLAEIQEFQSAQATAQTA